MPYIPRVNRHVALLTQKTVDGNPNYVKRRPGTITALAGGTNVDLRVQRVEFHANVPQRPDPDYDSIDVYVQY